MHAAYVYAFEKCGFLLTDANMHLFPQEDIDAWEAAIDEWIEAHPEEDEPNGATDCA